MKNNHLIEKNKKTKGVKMQINAKHSVQKIAVFVLTLFTIQYSLFTVAQAASVEATLSKTEVVQGNMVQLKIKALGDRAAFPNIREIGGSKVVGRHQGQNNSYSYVNGEMKSERSTSLVLTFAPQHDMTIPAYDINIDGTVYKTNPIALKVVESIAPKMLKNNKFSLQMRSNKKSVIVGEPVLVTVYFSLENGVQLSENPQYNKPQFKGFFVQDVGEEKNYHEGSRQVTELRYILTAQAEGNFTLGPATAKIGVADRNRRDMFGRFFGTSWTPIASNTVELKVEPKPQDSDLVGSFTMKSSIDKKSVKANKPVNLTVTIEGEGSLEDFDLENLEIDGVTIYSDDAAITTDLSNNNIQSTYVKRFVFISDRDFVIPARNISVYDSKLKTLKKLKIPSYNIKVEGAKSIVSATTTTPVVDNGKVQTNLKVPQKSMLDGTEVKNRQVEQTEWWILLLAFISGLLVMYLLKYLPVLKWKSKTSSLKTEEALKILYAHINESKEIEDMVRKLYAKKNGDKSVNIDKKLLKEILAKIEIKN